MSYRFMYQEQPGDADHFKELLNEGEWGPIVSLARAFLHPEARETASDVEALNEPTFDVSDAVDNLLGEDHPLAQQCLDAMIDTRGHRDGGGSFHPSTGCFPPLSPLLW